MQVNIVSIFFLFFILWIIAYIFYYMIWLVYQCYIIYGPRSYDLSPEIGRIQIWQDPRALPGSWDRAFVIFYLPQYHSYDYIYFQDGLDYPGEDTRYHQWEILKMILEIKRRGYKLYSPNQTREYAACYGVENYL